LDPIEVGAGVREPKVLADRFGFQVVRQLDGIEAIDERFEHDELTRLLWRGTRSGVEFGIGALLGFAMVCFLVGWVWFVVEAFLVNVLWGLGVLFVPPLFFVLVVLQWGRTWKPAALATLPLLVAYLLLDRSAPGTNGGAVLGGAVGVVFAWFLVRSRRRQV
jgi:O-antigen/teichoic acid export membrane protein